MNRGVLWSPEFSIKGVNGSGATDFHLGSWRCGVEFTRDGDQLTTHNGLFQPGGNYHRWILDGEFIDWVLLDIGSTIPIKKQGSKYDSFSPSFIGSTTLTKTLHRIPQIISHLFLDAISRVEVLGHDLNILYEFALLSN